MSKNLINKIYDLENDPVAKKEIEELISQLEVVCNRNRIPFFFTMAKANSEDKTSYYSAVMNPTLYNFSIIDDKFSDFVNILNGFKTYYSSSNSEDEEYSELIKEYEIKEMQNSDKVYEEFEEEISDLYDSEDSEDDNE